MIEGILKWLALSALFSFGLWSYKFTPLPKWATRIRAIISAPAVKL